MYLPFGIHYPGGLWGSVLSIFKTEINRFLDIKETKGNGAEVEDQHGLDE